MSAQGSGDRRLRSTGKHDVYWHGVRPDQVFHNALGGYVSRGSDDGQPVAGVQFLGRRSVEALLECCFECAALAIVGEQLEHFLMSEIPHP
jgi:hypothetical protein